MVKVIPRHLRTQVRLGAGDHIPADHPNIHAWREFLDAIHRFVPKVRAELAAIATRPTADDIEPDLTAWCKKWGLPCTADNGATPIWTKHLRLASWWQRMVRAQVQFQRANPSGEWALLVAGDREPGWLPPTWNPRTQEYDLAYQSLELRLDIDGLGQRMAVRDPVEWHPREESERAFRARALRRIKDYVARIKALPGSVPTPTTVHRRDFDAFVLEHVREMKIPEIVETLSKVKAYGAMDHDASSVRKQNTQIAQTLGLTLRRRHPGRPKKRNARVR